MQPVSSNVDAGYCKLWKVGESSKLNSSEPIKPVSLCCKKMKLFLPVAKIDREICAEKGPLIKAMTWLNFEGGKLGEIEAQTQKCGPVPVFGDFKRVSLAQDEIPISSTKGFHLGQK